MRRPFIMFVLCWCIVQPYNKPIINNGINGKLAIYPLVFDSKLKKGSLRWNIMQQDVTDVPLCRDEKVLLLMTTLALLDELSSAKLKACHYINKS